AEDEEEQEVEGKEYPQDACFQEQEPGKILPKSEVNLPGDEN
ncbi:unnamed protein product, partial [marine sediment metagenome]